MHTKTLKTTLLSTALAFVPSAVLAQDDDVFDQIVVTANKQAESLQDVPASIAVLTGDKLDSLNIDDLESINQFTAGLNIKTEGGPGTASVITLRGVANQIFNVEPRIGILFDHNSISDFEAISTMLFDIESVEVIRGPQSALFGLNSASGVINVKSARPGDELNGYVDFEIANRETYEIQAAVGGPITNKLGARLAVFATSSDGNLDSFFGLDQSVTTAAVRGVVTYEPTDNAALDLVLSYQDIDSDLGRYRVPTDRALYNTLFGIELEEFETGFDAATVQEVETFTAGLGGSFELGFAELAFDLGYRDRSSVDTFDSNGGPGNGLFPEINPFVPPTDPGFFLGFTDVGPIGITDPNTAEEIYADVRLASPVDDKLNWLLGFSYTDLSIDNRGVWAEGFPITASPFALIADNLVFDQQRAAETYGIYGRVGYEVTDRLSVAAALRYSWATRELDSVEVTDGSGFLTLIPFVDAEVDCNEWITRFPDDYQVNENLQVYASASKGWLPSGLVAVSIIDRVAYGEETAWSYEGGFNFQSPDRSLTLNAAAFYSIYDDFQDQVFIDAFNVAVQNAEELTVYGFEVDGSYSPIDGLTIFGGVAYGKSEYGTYLFVEPGDQDGDGFLTTDAEINGVDLDGNQIPNIPEWDYNLAARYEHESGLFIQSELTGATDFFETAENLVEFDGYTVFNLRAGYQFDNYSITAFVENLTDEEYILSAFTDGLGSPDGGTGILSGQNPALGEPTFITEGVPGMRRMFGVKLRADF